MTNRGGNPHGRPDGVNPVADPAAAATIEGGVARHLDGWRPALVITVVAIVSAYLVVPAAVAPTGVPLPMIDRRNQAARAAQRQARAREARAVSLPFEVRAVGEAFRRAGRAAAAGDREGLDEHRAQMRQRAAEARRVHGDTPLLRLRAVQAEMFVQAMHRARSGTVDDDARELGGELAEGGAGANGVATGVPDVDLASAFVVRWTLLAGLSRDTAFAPTLDDWRSLHWLRLSSPRGSGRERLRDQGQAVRSLGKLDPDYPAQLAEGMIAYQLGDFSGARKALRAFLDANAEGRWQLRARNYLAAAIEAAPPPPPDAPF